MCLLSPPPLALFPSQPLNLSLSSTLTTSRPLEGFLLPASCMHCTIRIGGHWNMDVRGGRAGRQAVCWRWGAWVTNCRNFSTRFPTIQCWIVMITLDHRDSTSKRFLLSSPFTSYQDWLLEVAVKFSCLAHNSKL